MVEPNARRCQKESIVELSIVLGSIEKIVFALQFCDPSPNKPIKSTVKFAMRPRCHRFVEKSVLMTIKDNMKNILGQKEQVSDVIRLLYIQQKLL
ncbi:hypothetical protein HI914_06724 [Erysiphe necator]|nr:hypothetical protein HI914_06724 [Erysiphe necator]